MNYRHIYHAGNFADVVKHVVLTLAIERLKLKGAAFRVIDTHAGIGSYDLDMEAARKTGEWQGGIGRLIGRLAEPIPPEVAPLMARYLEVVAGANRPGELSRYPGSPAIARALLRPQDRLVVNELHPQDAATLRAAFARDRQTTVMELDGWIALKALLPPKERRGLVLIDPPFEVAGEMERLAGALREAVKRFATGTFILWYPIKDAGRVRRFKRTLKDMGLSKLMVAELSVRADDDPAVLSGTGLAVLNPPFELEQQLKVLLPFLAKRLAVEPGAGHVIEWLGSAAR
jgi:23S rRNA (adenine2030-N6)-methyltransferase